MILAERDKAMVCEIREDDDTASGDKLVSRSSVGLADLSAVGAHLNRLKVPCGWPKPRPGEGIRGMVVVGGRG